jgi:hypothetical protein
MVKTGAKTERKRNPKINQKLKYFRFFQANQDSITFGPSQTCMRMINNLVTSKNIPLDVKKLQLKQKTFTIFKEAALNEVEVAVWGCLLERLAWENSEFSLWFRLLGCAIYSKEFLEGSVEYLISKYSKKDAGFLHNYREWRINCQKIELKIKDINKKYSEISIGKIETFDYNFYVDDIIFSYQPYKSYIKGNSLELYEDSDLDFFAEIESIPIKRRRRRQIFIDDEEKPEIPVKLLNLDL